MANKLADYLETFKNHLRIDSLIRNEAAREISAHIEDASRELQQKGFSEEEALRIATQNFGPPQLIAEQMCEVHSQGRWSEAFLAASPHFLVALLFASYYLQNIACLASVLVATAFIVIYGWRHNQPMWLFPWLGYYLLPVIATGILLIYLPQAWTGLAVLIYIPLVLFILGYILRQTVNRDWLYMLLMLVPIIVMCSWLVSSGTGSYFLASGAQLQKSVLWPTISFLALATATVAFVRMKQRWQKALALLIPASTILLSVALANRGNINLGAGFILILSLLALFIPVWMQVRLQAR